jgi:DNA-binding NarL/FixJ family response regulator
MSTNKNKQTIRILLVDDHAMVRNGIRLMLANDPDLHIMAEADTAQKALALVRQQSFDVALLDISLPDRSGLEVLKQLLECSPKLAVLVLSMYAEDIYAVRALRQGAAGYLTKDVSSAVMASAIRTAAAGGKVLSEATSQKLADLVLGQRSAQHEVLSDRELDVMKRIAAGDSLVDIAAHLFLSPSTVTTYRARILEKMNMKSNAELTRYVYGNSLLSQ